MSNNKEQLKKLQKQINQLKKQEKREPLSRKEWDDLLINSSKTGGSKVSGTMKKEISLFAKKQKASVYKPRAINKVPKWIYGLIESGKSEEEVFTYVLKRVKRSPSKQSLELLQYIVNDAGRKGNSPGFIKKMIPQELVTEFIQRTNAKKQ